MRNEIFWSDETQMPWLEELDTAHHLPDTMATVKYGGDSMMLWECFF